MKKVVVFLSVLLLAGFFYSHAATSETKEKDTADGMTAVAENGEPAVPGGVEDLIEWIKEKVANGELEAGEEEKARTAIENGDMDHLLEQAHELYEKYGIEVVEEANEVINEAVGNALTTALKGFFADIKDSVSDFFKNIFS